MTLVADKKAAKAALRDPERVGTTLAGAQRELTEAIAQLPGRHR
ncbi:hypothetical protein [Streptomyces collinus]